MEYYFKTNKTGQTILEIKGRIDAITYLKFETLLLDFFNADNNKLFIDFSCIEYISSAGLRALLKGLKKARTKNGRLVLFGLNEAVLEVFNISGFAKLFEINQDEKEALSPI